MTFRVMVKVEKLQADRVFEHSNVLKHQIQELDGNLPARP
jgi:hypothetical protein